jgi:hypothetical protein
MTSEPKGRLSQIAEQNAAWAWSAPGEDQGSGLGGHWTGGNLGAGGSQERRFLSRQVHPPGLGRRV